MANYECTIRTNYFHVRDPEAFRSFMSRVYGSESSVKLWQEKDNVGNPVFAFGCSGGIAGVRNAGEDSAEAVDESAYDEFLYGLQEHVAEDDAVILLEAGNEGLRYVTGAAIVVTSRHIEAINVSEIAKKRAAKLLVNPKWLTKCEY